MTVLIGRAKVEVQTTGTPLEEVRNLTKMKLDQVAVAIPRREMIMGWVMTLVTVVIMVREIEVVGIETEVVLMVMALETHTSLW
jgi:hypothetical protein